MLPKHRVDQPLKQPVFGESGLEYFFRYNEPEFGRVRGRGVTVKLGPSQRGESQD